MRNRTQVLIRVATMENEELRLAGWQRFALLAGAAALALTPFSLGAAHGFYQGPDNGPQVGGDDEGAYVPIPGVDAFGIETPASAKSAKSGGSAKKANRSQQPAPRIAPQAQVAVQPVMPAPAVRAELPLLIEAGGTGSPAVETPPFATGSSYQLSDTQAMAIAISLGGGLTPGDVKAMTKDELITAAKARGMAPDQLAAAAGMQPDVLNQSMSGDVLAAGGLLLAGGVAAWRRLKPYIR